MPDADVRHVFKFPNGMVAVCGHDGKQIAELQGPYSEALHREITDRSDEQTEWNGLQPFKESVVKDAVAASAEARKEEAERVPALWEMAQRISAGGHSSPRTATAVYRELLQAYQMGADWGAQYAGNHYRKLMEKQPR